MGPTDSAPDENRLGNSDPDPAPICLALWSVASPCLRVGRRSSAMGLVAADSAAVSRPLVQHLMEVTDRPRPVLWAEIAGREDGHHIRLEQGQVTALESL
jgi:hypothetical protein